MQQMKTVYINERNYPALLKEINDPPNPLYYIGDIALASKRCVAVVGSRKATDYGHWAADRLGERLGTNDLVVVSGMAKGIDTCAHKGALKGGKTIAVLGCGINLCYPAINKQLKAEIERTGLVLSEYPPDTPVARYMFPRRNRIISGISEATVVVQAGNQSGALITAELAAEQGRNVYAIPGNINNIYNLGNNKLLKDGAIPLVILDDLLEDLGIETKENKKIKNNLGADEKLVYNQLQKGGEMTVDQLCEAVGRHPAQINGIVTVLEMKGVVFTSLGKIFIAK